MVGTLSRQTDRRARTHRVQRGPTRVLRGGRTREIWRDLLVRGVHFASEAEGRFMFDYQARKTFGISGDEFLARYDAGEYNDLTDMDEIHKVNRQVMLMPAVRRIRA
jgi:hypothetical protein